MQNLHCLLGLVCFFCTFLLALLQLLSVFFCVSKVIFVSEDIIIVFLDFRSRSAAAENFSVLSVKYSLFQKND